MASKQIKLAVTLTSHVDEKLNPIIKHLSDMARHTDRDMKLMSEGFAKLAGGIRGIALPALATFGVSAGGVVASIIGVSTQLSNLSRKSEDMRYASDWSRLSMSRINEMTNAVDVFGRSLPKLQTDIQQLGKLGFELSQGFTTSYVQGLKQSFHEHGLEREFSTLVGKQGDQLDDAIGAMIAKLTTRQREYVAQILGLTDEYVRRALDLQMAKKYNINLKFQIDEEAAEKFREQQLKFSSLFGEIETDIRNQLLGPFTQFTGEFNTWVELHKGDIANNVVKFFEGIVTAVKGVHTFFGWIDKGSKKTGRWLGKGLHGFKDMSKPPPGPATPPDNKGWWEHLKSGLHHPDSSTPYKFEEQEAPEEAVRRGTREGTRQGLEDYFGPRITDDRINAVPSDKQLASLLGVFSPWSAVAGLGRLLRTGESIPPGAGGGRTTRADVGGDSSGESPVVDGGAGGSDSGPTQRRQWHRAGAGGLMDRSGPSGGDSSHPHETGHSDATAASGADSEHPQKGADAAQYAQDPVAKLGARRIGSNVWSFGEARKNLTGVAKAVGVSSAEVERTVKPDDNWGTSIVPRGGVKGGAFYEGEHDDNSYNPHRKETIGHELGHIGRGEIDRPISERGFGFNPMTGQKRTPGGNIFDQYFVEHGRRQGGKGLDTKPDPFGRPGANVQAYEEAQQRMLDLMNAERHPQDEGLQSQGRHAQRWLKEEGFGDSKTQLDLRRHNARYEAMANKRLADPDNISDMASRLDQAIGGGRAKPDVKLNVHIEGDDVKIQKMKADGVFSNRMSLHRHRGIPKDEPASAANMEE